MTRLPPRSTLFPYTTLFRSDPTTSGHSFRVANLTVGLASVVDHVTTGPYASLRFTTDEMMELRYAADRKSTRLNSSHTVISYAVFCLKKKKHKHDTVLYREP